MGGVDGRKGEAYLQAQAWQSPRQGAKPAKNGLPFFEGLHF